jgi:hypothetical protein
MADKLLTDDEFLGGGKPAPAGKLMSDDEFLGTKPAAQTKLLDNTGDDGWISGLAKGTATGVIKGLSHIPGVAGDIRDMGTLGVSGLQSLPYVGNGKSWAENLQDDTQAVHNSPLGYIPNGADISGAIGRNVTGEYQPESTIGRIAQAGVEGATSMLSPVPGMGGLNAMREAKGVAGTIGTAAREMVPAALASGVGQGLSEVSDNPGLSLIGSTAAALTGTAGAKGVGAVVKNRSAAGREANANAIAGQIAREAANDPQAVAQRVAQQPEYLDGVKPQTADVARDEGITGLRTAVGNIDRQGEGLHNATLAQQQEDNVARTKSAGDTAGDQVVQANPNVDVQSTYQLDHLDPRNPMGEASIAARNALDILERGRDASVNAAWQAPELQGVRISRSAAVKSLQDYLNGLGEVRGPAFPAKLRQIVDGLAGEPQLPGAQPGSWEAYLRSGDDGMSYKSLQDLRSMALTLARKARDNPDVLNTGDIYGLADRVKDIMSNPDLLRNAGPETIDAWNKARELTRQYHEDFGGDFTKKLTNDVGEASRDVAPEATFNRIFSGANAAQNLRDLQGIPGLDIDSHAADWLVGKLTGNGTKAVTADQVRDFKAKNASILEQLPNLEPRLDAIADAAKGADLATVRQKIGQRVQQLAQNGDFGKLASFINDNRADIDASLSPEQKAHLQRLVATAETVGSAKGAGRMAGSATLDAARRGDAIDIFHGGPAAKAADIVGGGIAGTALDAAGGALGVPLGGVGKLAGAVAGAFGKGKDFVGRTVGNLFYGDATDRALGKVGDALRDPAAMAELLRQAPIEQQGLGAIGANVAKGSIPAAVAGARQIDDTQNDIVVHPKRGTGYAKGGQVSYTEPSTLSPSFMHDLIREMGARHFDKGGLAESAGAGLVKGALSRLPYSDPPSTRIADWIWRPQADVKAQLGLTELPQHVQDFGTFMGDMAGKAGGEGLSPRDLIKAYTITRSSIQRGAVDADKVRATGLRLPDDVGAKVRPEGAFSEWLLTPEGQRYLDAAQKGNVDDGAVRSAVQTMAPFGKHETDIPDALTWAAKNLPGREGLASDLVDRGWFQNSTPDEWRNFTQDIRGIGPSKSGFFASLLGRGDQPTLDARQLILHTGQPTSEAQRFLRRGGGEGGRDAVDRLAARQADFGVDVPDSMSPAYQHLVHHAVWDQAGGDTTTHADVMRAMRLAGVGAGAVGLGAVAGSSDTAQAAEAAPGAPTGFQWATPDARLATSQELVDGLKATPLGQLVQAGVERPLDTAQAVGGAAVDMAKDGARYAYEHPADAAKATARFGVESAIQANPWRAAIWNMLSPSPANAGEEEQLKAVRGYEIGGQVTEGLAGKLIKGALSRLTRTGADLVAKDPAAAEVKLSTFGKPITELEHTIEPKNNLEAYKPLHPEDLYKEGAYIAPALGDRTAANARLVAVDGTPLSSPVDLQGGGDYQRSGLGGAWASRPGPVSRMTDMWKEQYPGDGPLYLSHTLMGLPAADSSHMNAQALLRQIPALSDRLDPKAAEQIDTVVRRLYPTFPGIMKPDESEAWLFPQGKTPNGKAASTVVQAIDKRSAEKGGFPDLGAIRLATMDPRLVSADQLASGYSLARVDPSLERILSPDHQTYGAMLKGDYAGGLPYQVPAEAMFTDWGKQRAEAAAAGKMQSPTMLQQALLTQQPVQKANQEWLDTVMPYFEQGRKWGYREGGYVD